MNQVTIAKILTHERNVQPIKFSNPCFIGIHAREWIGPAATTWMINEILNDLSDPIWSKFNYLYVPNANADGYAYTWSTVSINLSNLNFEKNS